MYLLRRTAEVLLRRVVVKRSISVLNNRIPLYVAADAQLKYLKFGINAFDQDLIRIAELVLCRGWNVWDIGANIGTFSMAASEIIKQGQVVSVEADFWLASLINKSANLNLNKSKNIKVVSCAISDKDSVVSFNISSRGRARSALAGFGYEKNKQPRETINVPSLKLDTLLNAFDPPDFLKIDVEGAEYLVLKGAQDIISSIRPIFYIEVGPSDRKKVQEIFAKNRYFEVFPYDRCSKEQQLQNLFFIPDEKSEETKSRIDKLNL